ncbi:MAG: transglutaminase family protein [Chitinophagaceae bacterium]
MKGQQQELQALLRLIDDPDTEVYQTVAARILDYGAAIIPPLEALWEVTEDQQVQSRIENLIHRVHFQDLEKGFHDWGKQKTPSLLQGAILIARLQYPELNSAEILSQVDKIRRNIWLELNPYLTALEQVNVFNSIIYSYCRLQGHELGKREPKHFFINQLLETKQGNGYSIGILYLTLCEMFDIPVYAVDIPRQLVFAYFNQNHPLLIPRKKDLEPQIAFFVDPMNGAIYSQNDVDAYLHKIGNPHSAATAMPLNAKKLLYKMMEELVLCHRYRREEEKADEVQLLMRLIV